MVRAMTGGLQESLKTLAILNPCFGLVVALLPIVSQVSIGLRLALTSQLTLP